MKRNLQLEFNKFRRMSGWNEGRGACHDGKDNAAISLPIGRLLLKKPKYPRGKALYEGYLYVTQPCAIESDERKREIFDWLKELMQKPHAWHHLKLDQAVRSVDSIVPRCVGKGQYEIDVQLLLGSKSANLEIAG